MRYAYNSIAIGLFIGISLLTFRKQHFKLEKALLIPIALYVLMVCSLLWTEDPEATRKALFKVFPLLLVPICYLVNKSFSSQQVRKIITYFGYSYFVFAVFYIVRAVFRFFQTQITDVFFYHELVTADVNAIHVSIYMAIAYFSILTKPNKIVFDRVILFFFVMLIVLLSSKNVIVVFFVLNGVYMFYHSEIRNRKRILLMVLGFGLLSSALFFQKIKKRFEIEIASNMNDRTINPEISSTQRSVYNATIKEAWTMETFNQNYFFPGTALRVYQFRIFLEMMQEHPAYLTGYGLNATHHKIKEKRIQHDLYEGYDQFNFHNQYIQFFAEIGVFGFLLILVMVFYNLKNALLSKDFTYISFAILMISLFLTESFLSRQRGVIFFIALYCFFNTHKTISPKTEGE